MKDDPKKLVDEQPEEAQNDVPKEDTNSQEADFDALSSSFDEADGFEEAAEPKDEEQAEEVELVEEPEEDEPEPKAEEAPEPEGEPVEPAAEAKAEPEPEPEPVEEPGKPDLNAQRERWISDLESHFSLTEDEATEIAVTPEKAVPRLMAKMAVKITEMMVPALATTMPQVIEAQSSMRSRQQEAEKTFFERWPQLEAHRDRVTRIAEVHRKLNPTASVEEFIDEVGAQAIVALKLSPQVTEPKGKARPASGPKARGTVPSTSSQGRAPENAFEQFAMELLEDD